MGLVISLVLQTAVSVAFVAFSLLNGFVPKSFKTPRIAHAVLAVVVLGAAHLMGSESFLSKVDTAHSLGQLKSLDLSRGCDDQHLRPCQAAQVVYRASASLFCYFLSMAALGGLMPYVYTRLWGVKLLAVMVCMGFFMFLPDTDLFVAYAALARVLSVVWMLFQGFLVLDFAHDLHDLIATKAEEQDARSGMSPSVCSSWWRILYLTLSACFMVAALVGIVDLYMGFTGCKLGSVLVMVTVVVGVGSTVVSLTEVVGVGLLPPSILFAYSTFLCWYALTSHPDSACNPSADTDLAAGGNMATAVGISLTLLCLTVAWCAWHGEKMLGLFGTDGESLLMSATTGTRYKGTPSAEGRTSRVFYCIVMACASAFAAMAMTSWARSDGAPEGLGGTVVPLESMWLKLAAQWASLALQMWVLWVTYRETAEGSAYQRF